MMNKNQQRVKEFMERIPSQAKHINSKPTMPPLNIRKLAAKVILEEAMETINFGLGLDIRMIKWIQTGGKDDILDESIEFETLHFEESKQRQPDLIELADGLADLEVVLLDAANFAGIPQQAVFDEVMDNNMLKLENGMIDAVGKLVKPVNHPKPNIARVLSRGEGLPDKIS
jgi:predicted HAD superfamily Cof-like phosphohydrolase